MARASRCGGAVPDGDRDRGAPGRRDHQGRRWRWRWRWWRRRNAHRRVGEGVGGRCIRGLFGIRRRVARPLGHRVALAGRRFRCRPGGQWIVRRALGRRRLRRQARCVRRLERVGLAWHQAGELIAAEPDPAGEDHDRGEPRDPPGSRLGLGRGRAHLVGQRRLEGLGEARRAQVHLRDAGRRHRAAGARPVGRQRDRQRFLLDEGLVFVAGAFEGKPNRLERLDQTHAVGRPVVGFLAQAAHHQGGEVGGAVGRLGDQLAGLFVENLVEHRGDLLAGEGPGQGEELVGEDAERKDIGPRVRGPAADLLRSEVGRGADGHAGLGEIGVLLKEFGDAEIP